MLYIGTSGWFYRGWKGLYYPEDLPPNEWFKFYAKDFNTVEINSTFYRGAKKANLRKWKREVPSNFLFTLKAFRVITHIKRLRDSCEDLEAFLKEAQGLEENLGPILFQLPPSLKCSAELLRSFLDCLPQDFKFAFEFREESWFNSKEIEDLLREKNCAFVIVSAPNLPEIVKVTADWAYIRFHGKTAWYNYLYSEEEIESWALKIKEIAKNVKNIFVYFNNDTKAYAIKNAKLLRDLTYSAC
ncbi:MAG: DUF72 domain-containing protein [Synergistetes bacterium]|nr:DUF72 domain-containing protein [Synergistota bacterium]MCX8128418.1 DUF72 domain-containing protein [Synergistota bacterium]MDW8192904.1 DUF72 domain-containing protein [Synergistota bacterium]